VCTERATTVDTESPWFVLLNHGLQFTYP
jgi:hypothetical protein